MTFPKLGLGTWQFGGRVEYNPDNDDAADIAAIRNAIELGIRHIDTAQLYAGGKTEEFVGAAIKPFNRSDLIIASSVDDLGHDDVLKSCENSLRRLGIDYLDLYYIHKPQLSVPFAETAKAFNRLLAEGLIRNAGISNAKIETLENYQRHLDRKFFASQNSYNLIVRESVETGLLDYCRQNGIHFVAWRPLQLPAPNLGIESLTKRGAYPILDDMADKYEKTNAQIAIRWLTQQENVSAIFKSANPDHVREILDTENWRLSDADWKNLSDNFPLRKNAGFNTAGAPLTLI